MSAPWWRRGVFTKDVIREIIVEVNMWVNVSMILFRQKKYMNKRKSEYRNDRPQSAKPQSPLWRMPRGYRGWDQENTCCWDAESSPQRWPRSTRPRWANTDMKIFWAILFPKRWNDVLQSQGLGVKGLFPALCCHDSPVAEAGFPNRLKVNTTLGYSRVKGNNRRRCLRKGSGGGHLREDDMASSFGATKNNGV